MQLLRLLRMLLVTPFFVTKATMNTIIHDNHISSFGLELVDADAFMLGEKSRLFAGCLGNNVKSQAICNFPARNPMIERYKLLAESKRILAPLVRPGHNLVGCQRVAVSASGAVGVARLRDTSVLPYERGYHFDGVKTCKSVWVCPVCSYRLAGVRASEVRQAIYTAKLSGHDVYMMTLTFRHSKFDQLDVMLSRFKSALSRLWCQRAVKDLFSNRFFGRITATEITYSDKSGWHPHQHILLLGNKGLSCDQLQADFAGRWVRALAASRLSGIDEVACNVQPAAAVQDYLTKMSHEIATGNAGYKQGRAGGYSPFGLLAASRTQDAYRRLWREYYTATKGKRALCWSRGLKALCGVSDVSDADAMDLEASRYEIVLQVVSEDWRELLTNQDLGYIRRAPSVDSIVDLLIARGARFWMGEKKRSA